MSDRLQEIKASKKGYAPDRRWLIAEVERLRAALAALCDATDECFESVKFFSREDGDRFREAVAVAVSVLQGEPQP